MPQLTRIIPFVLLATLAGCGSVGNDSQQSTPVSRPLLDKVTTFLMFQDGRAEEAIEFYISLFEDAEITR